jgi:hypothetical protein
MSNFEDFTIVAGCSVIVFVSIIVITELENIKAEMENIVIEIENIKAGMENLEMR